MKNASKCVAIARRHRSWQRIRVAVALVGITGCVAAGEVDELDLAPASLEAAEVSLARLDGMFEADPDDVFAREALETLRPRLDELNHLVARVDVGPDHTVSFYEVEPGVIGVSESAPEGEERVLVHEDVLGVPVTEIYERLAKAPAPTTLALAQEREEAAAQIAAEAEAQIAAAEFQATVSESPLAESSPEHFSGLGEVRSALTGSQGSYFRDQYCFAGGEFRGCYPNWSGGAFATANAKTSFFTIAPYSGAVSVRFRYEGSIKFTDAVFSGEVHSWWWHSSTYRTNGWLPFSPRDYRRRTHRWDILNASGNRSHWTYTFRWDCSYHQCDSWLR